MLPDGTEETREQLQNCQEENGQQNWKKNPLNKGGPLQTKTILNCFLHF